MWKKFTVNKERDGYLLRCIGRQLTHHSETYIWTNRGMLSEWEYFGKLWDFSTAQPWFGYFVRDIIGEASEPFGPLFFPVSQQFINPENLANALYPFLRKNIGKKYFEGLPLV